MQTLGTLTGNGTSDGVQPPTGRGMIRILFTDVAGTVKLQHSFDDVDANYEDAIDPVSNEVLSVTATKTVACPGRLFFRIVGSGGVTNASLQFQAEGDASS